MATFYIEAIEAAQIALVKVGSPTIGTVKYGVNDSTCPNTYTVTTSSTPISLMAGQKCYWTITSTTTAFTATDYLNFTSTAKINVGGDLSDLIGGNTAIPRSYCFFKLFYNCTNLVNADNLVLVNDFNSKICCYYRMFSDCTSLITTPSLPATALASYCYYYMFSDCTSLATAPELPATTLTSYCYTSMFQNCTSLTAAPVLPATALADKCYQSMFYNCTSLEAAPALPATMLASECYRAMFDSCTSLRAAPASLPATTLADGCYRAMFQNCASLTTAPELPATTLTDSCYYHMFYGCTSLKLSTTQTGKYKIPYRIPKEETGTTATDALSNMFYNTGGTFTGTPAINTTYYLWKDSSALTVTYNGSTIISEDVDTPCIVSYKGNTLASIDANTTKTLNCNGKYMEDNVSIGDKTLNCAGKVMASNVVVEVV